MTVYADTSFLFAVYLPDPNTLKVRDYLKKHRGALVFTSWQRCELSNAIRLAGFRHHCDDAAVVAALEKIEKHVLMGNLEEVPLIWPEVFTTAESISARHTMKLGVRTLDLLHVAAAKAIKAKTFLTFDVRQHALAKAAGLRVGP
jgi:hypothetical protein